jgi:hypothetical protein
LPHVLRCWKRLRCRYLFWKCWPDRAVATCCWNLLLVDASHFCWKIFCISASLDVGQSRRLCPYPQPQHLMVLKFLLWVNMLAWLIGLGDRREFGLCFVLGSALGRLSSFCGLRMMLCNSNASKDCSCWVGRKIEV